MKRIERSAELTPADEQHLAQWREALQNSLDAALSNDEQRLVADHLIGCALCSAEFQDLSATDAFLNEKFSALKTTRSPSSNFDERLLTTIATNEQVARRASREIAEREHQARLAQLQREWRELLQRNMSHVVGAIAALIAVVIISGSSWQLLANRLVGMERLISLVRGMGLSLVPILGVLIYVLIAVSAIWLTKRNDRELR